MYMIIKNRKNEPLTEAFPSMRPKANAQSQHTGAQAGSQTLCETRKTPQAQCNTYFKRANILIKVLRPKT
jgi:hypothetical protein